ncbi:hypothetical protein LCGC14_0828490 [marine sediment metagenome]|uniref:DNA 3'-5' helicase n=1 Tax=marine sediment metagenome TaxID=412755 RepID=A0A0F9Q1V6_9ZZZZ
MTTVRILKDDAARRDAISGHDRSILVEAGAGSGKTAVMAGRVAVMLAQGVAPRAIAAVTFTELAASELLSRVRQFVEDLAADHVAPELRVGLPDGLSEEQRANLAAASAAIDEITCSTIHGFCQRLIKPYPVEADIDPGATVMDGAQADLAFLEIVDAFLRERLSAGQGGVLAEMVLREDGETVQLMHRIAGSLRRGRTLVAPAVTPLPAALQAFCQAVGDLSSFIAGAGATEPETVEIAQCLTAMAAALPSAGVAATPAGLVALLTSRPHPGICTKAGAFSAYAKKGKWGTAAKAAGLSKTDGDQLNDTAKDLYEACRNVWNALLQSAAGHALAALMAEARPIMDRFRDYKRASAQLDFDDLIHAARDMLRDHEDVRQALGRRYQRVLVDEFQDTDPLQSEIFWRLCGDPGEGGGDWTTFRIRAGALFLVGDPKQAIYRFRGADVGAYVQARTAFSAQDTDGLVSISTNFRSCGSILTFVNERFEAILSADGQPGFTGLDPFHGDPAGGVCVAALDVAAADEDGNAKVERQRDAEADAVAELCARLIGSHQVIDRGVGMTRPCQPGDIALLAPTGTELWRYEEALERRGVPVATQAGKGLFRRQEVQDLIALTRLLADRRDTLAFGALLRGPLVGLTEEELLDIVWSLPRSDDEADRIPRLDLGVDLDAIGHPLARNVIGRLQSLQRRVNSTTPHDLLSQAVDVMRVRPILLDRHRRQAERALANVDLYLSLAVGYAVRGLRAFSEAMTAAWEDEARAVEGRPDAQEEAVALFTMHAAKGLEWPAIIPVNTMTGVMAADSAIVDRETDTFYCPVLGVAPTGYDEARDAEVAELERERVRLWYVAATRARELLILPRLDVTPHKGAWIGLVDLMLTELPAFDPSELPLDPIGLPTATANGQTREVYAEEAAGIIGRRTSLVWLAPSRDESAAGPVLLEEQAAVWAGSEEGLPTGPEAAPVQGGRDRGLVLHKLMEEVLTGETGDALAGLAERAGHLIRSLGKVPVEDPADGLSPQELADCVVRTLALPQVAELRPALLAEFPVYAVREEDAGLVATAGIADALTAGADGRPAVIVDWKSDVASDQQTVEHYRMQVRAYLDMTGAELGLIVLMTSGRVVAVTPTPKPIAA